MGLLLDHFWVTEWLLVGVGDGPVLAILTCGVGPLLGLLPGHCKALYWSPDCASVGPYMLGPCCLGLGLV